MLSEGDRAFLQTEFNRIHDRINKTDSDIHEVKDEIVVQIGKHVEDKHNPIKTWTIFGAIVAGLSVLLELGKWLLKKGDH